jgi:maleate isomerase
VSHTIPLDASRSLPDHRVGLILPSSNTTMETELPAMVARRAAAGGETFTFHSSRTRMRSVTAEALSRAEADGERCAAELADAGVDVIAYACLASLMSRGAYHHLEVERRLAAASETPVITSSGALLAGLRALGARRIAMLAPHTKPITDLIAGSIEETGIEVVDVISLEVEDNRAVGRIDPMSLLDHLGELDVSSADAVVLSACVQCPSLPAIPAAEARTGLPVLSAGGAIAFRLLESLGLDTAVPGAGALLDGTRSSAAAEAVRLR